MSYDNFISLSFGLLVVVHTQTWVMGFSERYSISFYVLSMVIGEIDAEKDASIDLSTIRADPLPPIRHG